MHTDILKDINDDMREWWLPLSYRTKLSAITSDYILAFLGHQN